MRNIAENATPFSSRMIDPYNKTPRGHARVGINIRFRTSPITVADQRELAELPLDELSRFSRALFIGPAIS